MYMHYHGRKNTYACIERAYTNIKLRPSIKIKHSKFIFWPLSCSTSSKEQPSFDIRKRILDSQQCTSKWERQQKCNYTALE